MRNLEKAIRNKDFEINKGKLLFENLGCYNNTLIESFTPKGKRYLVYQMRGYEEIYTGQYIDVSSLGEISDYCLSEKMLILLK